jgi:hypothetical protein
VVGVSWLPAADQARLLANEPDVIAVADSSRLGGARAIDIKSRSPRAIGG